VDLAVVSVAVFLVGVVEQALIASNVPAIPATASVFLLIIFIVYITLFCSVLLRIKVLILAQNKRSNGDYWGIFCHPVVTMNALLSNSNAQTVMGVFHWVKDCTQCKQQTD
jgi:hypothetical protein